MFRIVFLQGVLTVLLGLVGVGAGSVAVGKSAFIGGVIAVLPNYYLASRMSVSCLLYTSPSPRDATLSRMPSSA